jgi:hypothetical protein
MLDFDFICKRDRPSVAAFVFPFSGNHFQKFYFGTKEILIPVFQKMEDALNKCVRVWASQLSNQPAETNEPTNSRPCRRPQTGSGRGFRVCLDRRVSSLFFAQAAPVPLIVDTMLCCPG